jgi:hypothetical protein
VLVLTASLATGDLTARDELHNPDALVPPQCYTKTEGRFNPCYVCHQDPANGRVNHMQDAILQVRYDFTDTARTNHWRNLFGDRRSLVNAVSDAEILTYVDQDNFSPLPERLRQAGYNGYVPVLKELTEAGRAFKDDGLARDGSHWVAFNYKPFPSTFWPANGSMGDVMIRLPERFHRNRNGQPDRTIYRLNLVIVEAAIKNLAAIPIQPTDERALGIDLDDDGRLGVAVIRLKRPKHYLGAASGIEVTPFLYPLGTEFLHTVRYLGVTAEGNIYPPRRMKEVRYMRKHTFLPVAEVRARYAAIQKQEKDGARLAQITSLGDRGLDNGFGWEIQGFIEDTDGALRPQTYEEKLFCMGCHRSIGAPIDHTFAFPRKVTGPAGWGYIDLRGMPDAPSVGEQDGEILQYLRRVGGGDEFRENTEIIARFFDVDGRVKEDAVRAADVYTLVTPSRQRALELNKTYLTIVREQSYVYGRDANLGPMQKVYHHVNFIIGPTFGPTYRYQTDIRLDWKPTGR